MDSRQPPLRPSIMQAPPSNSDGDGEIGGGGNRSDLPGAPFPPRPRAIATFLSSADFLPGCQTALHSARRHLAPTPEDEYPPEFVVLLSSRVTDGVEESLHPYFCDRIIRVEHIPIKSDPNDSDAGENKPSHVQSWDENCGWTKLRLFELDGYDTILYIDADCLVVKGIGHLLHVDEQATVDEDTPERKGLLAAAPDIFPPDKFNAGVMVIRPSKVVFDEMISRLPNYGDDPNDECKSYDGGDTGFLNSFYPNWYSQMPSYSRLPFGYNAQRFMHHCTYGKQPKYWDDAIDDIRIVHYSSSPKPWDKAAKHKSEEIDNGSYLDGTDANAMQMAKHGKLERMWQEAYRRSEQHYANELQKQLTSAKRSAARAQRKAPPPRPSATPAAKAKPQSAHDLVHKRYKELRKTGMSTKDAMAAARAEHGLDKADHQAMDPGKAVGQMFGLM